MGPAATVFTPSLQPPALLERLFVAREPLLEQVVQRVQEAASSRTRSHTLIVGPRGSVKTHLLTLAHSRVRAFAEEGLRVAISWLPEDPWTISSYENLLVAVLDHLDPRPAVDRRADAEGLERALVEVYERDGPVVCFVENLDQVLDLIGPLGQQRLRHLAQQRVLLFIATSTQVSQDLWDQARPFYGFFTTNRLRPFTVDEAAEMLELLARERDDERTANYLRTDRARARLRVVEHLAGGQPRIWSLLSRAISVAGLDELVGLLLTQFDDLTPYYQEQLGRLAPQQRQVVITLAETDRPMTVKDLADRIGAAQRSLSRTLLDLKDRGWVTEVDSVLTRMLDRRLTYYELAEPLVRLPFQIKAARNRPIELIVDFLKHWFDRADLVVADGAGTAAHDYLVTAATSQGTDLPLTLTRHLQGLPLYRRPAIDQMAELDDALAALADGNSAPLLAMSSSVRAAIEDRIDEQQGLAAQVTTIRIELHHVTAQDFGYFSEDQPLPWLVRARAMVSTSSDRSGALGVVVRWLLALRRFDDAQLVTDEIERATDRDDRTLLQARHELGVARWSAGQYHVSLEVLSEALEARERVFGTDHAETLASRRWLAAALQFAGRDSEALQLRERTLADRERTLGTDHPETLQSRSDLAVSLWLAGRFDEAVLMTEWTLVDRERVLGPDHPDTLQSRANRAGTLLTMGHFDEGLALQAQTLGDQERVLGPDHPATMQSRSRLATSMLLAGRFDDGLALFERTLADRVRVLGSDHPDTLESRSDLGMALFMADRIEEALAMDARTLSDMERVLGPQHPQTERARETLSRTLGALGGGQLR